MKKKAVRTRRSQDIDTLQAEYDFRGGIRGKHAAQYASGTNVVVLEPDVAAIFPNAEAVNEALRALAKIIGSQRLRRSR